MHLMGNFTYFLSHSIASILMLSTPYSVRMHSTYMACAYGSGVVAQVMVVFAVIADEVAGLQLSMCGCLPAYTM